MNKNIVTVVLIGATGIAIYLFSKSLKEKRKKLLQKRIDEFKTRPNSAYPYEYTL